MTFGTPIGAIHPNQACTSKPFNVSPAVGISGEKENPRGCFSICVSGGWNAQLAGSCTGLTNGGIK